MNVNVLPSMDSKNIDRDSNGVVTIKPMPILVYIVGVATVIFGVGALVGGDIFLGIIGVLAGIFFFWRGKKAGTPFEFNPKTRIFRIGTDLNAVNIPFDDIAGFGVATQKETGNFTQKIIVVALKDGRMIELGVITDANEKAREEKVSKMMEFLYKTTGIELNV